MLSYQMMRNKLIGSKEALDNFQFVTINGKIEFDELGKVTRIAYSNGVKAGINLALKGVSLNDAVKELYKIIPTRSMPKLLINKPLVENNGNKIEIRKKWIACRGNKSDKGNRGDKISRFRRPRVN